MDWNRVVGYPPEKKKNEPNAVRAKCSWANIAEAKIFLENKKKGQIDEVGW